MDSDIRTATGNRDASVIRIAAIGDLHAGRDCRGQFRPGFVDIDQRADLLLIAGDLTQHGLLEEGELLADELAGLGLPAAAILGNHDYHNNADEKIRLAFEQRGILTLEGQSSVFVVRGRRVGVAGVKGFGGGFAGACGTEFGEPEMKAFIHHSKLVAARLAEQLDRLECDVRIAMTHYAPIKDTLLGERLEIYPFLGSYLLSEAIDRAGCDLALHGHAHHGTELGLTPAGVPVRNVARPVIRSAYRIYSVGARAQTRRATELSASA
jgi:Icc-related predicted phosphoesterase